MKFDGKVALVTGGARGIGAATSERFAAEGAAVVVSDLDHKPAEETAGKISGGGGKALAMALLDVDKKVFGRIQGLVIAAAVQGITVFSRPGEVIRQQVRCFFLGFLLHERGFLPRLFRFQIGRGELAFLNKPFQQVGRESANAVRLMT